MWRYDVTSQNTWIFSSTFVTTSDVLKGFISYSIFKDRVRLNDRCEQRVAIKKKKNPFRVGLIQFPKACEFFM
jgi:hypothetical protein